MPTYPVRVKFSTDRSGTANVSVGSKFHSPASTSPLQSRRGSSRTAPPDQSSQADHPSRKSPRAACPHQKSRIDPSYKIPESYCDSQTRTNSARPLFFEVPFNVFVIEARGPICHQRVENPAPTFAVF